MSRFPATGHPWHARPARDWIHAWHGRPARDCIHPWDGRPARDLIAALARPVRTPIAVTRRALRTGRSVLFLTAALAVAAASGAELSFQISDQKGAPVADAVVSLVRLDNETAGATAADSPAPEPVQIVQEGLEFRPYVTAIRIGTPIVFPNHDTVQHHVYSVSKPKNFELPLYMPGKAETVVFDQPGAIVIGCNIHDWMSAHVLVLETPWFARTGESGAATLAAPAGRYRAEVWHPRLPKMATQELTLGDSSPAALTFTLALRPDRRIRRAPTAKGGGYR